MPLCNQSLHILHIALKIQIMFQLTKFIKLYIDLENQTVSTDTFLLLTVNS